MTQQAVVIGGVQMFAGGANFVGIAPAVPPFDVTVTVDLSASIGTIPTALGASHIQHSLEYSSADPSGVGRAMQLERDLAVDWNLTHMMGSTFAMRSALSPSAGAAASTYNWTTSGSQRGLDTSAGAVFPMLKTLNQGKTFLVAFSAETYQNSGVANDPPGASFYSDYANEVVNVILRSEAVGGKAAIRGVGVWNEMKGLYSAGGRTQAKMEAHADLFKAIYTAVKAHDSTILVTGPHLNVGGYTNQPDRHDPLNPASNGGYDYNALRWWLNRVQVNGSLPDVLTLDYSIVDFGSGDPDIGNLANIAAGVGRFSVIKSDADAMMQTAWGLKKPIWWIEQYFDVNLARTAYNDGGTYSQPFQGAMAGGRYLEYVNSGAQAAFWWQPDSRDGKCEDGWWHITGTASDPASGTPYAPYSALKTIRGALPLGAAQYATSADQTYMKSAAVAGQCALVNMSAVSVVCRVLVNPGGTSHLLTIPAWGVATQAIP